MTKVSKAEREEALTHLREYLKPGDTVHTILRHVSRSGMMRVIQPVAVHDDTLRHLGWWVAKACGFPYDRNHEGVRVGGCGMNMGFHLVYELSYYLWPDGFDCSGVGCPSNDHTNRSEPPANSCTEYEGEGKCHNLECVKWHHRDGGYALKHRWL